MMRTALQWIATAGVFLGICSFWGACSIARTEKAPFRVLYNNDSTNIYHCLSPWHKSADPVRPREGLKSYEYGEQKYHMLKEPITDEKVAASVKEVAGSSVDAYMFAAGRGWIPFWNSDIYPDHYQWWSEKTGKDVDAYGRYRLGGGDMIKVAVETCRKYDMAPFVSYRLNDVHRLEHAGSDHDMSIWVSKFYEAHPEYRLCHPNCLPYDSNSPQTYGAQYGHDWSIPEVRDHKFAFMEEICKKYDIAGLELDFLRSGTLYSAETPLERRVEITTEFVKRVRRMLDETGRQSRRYLCVRIPQTLHAHPNLGIDAAKLYDAGVDMFNLSSHFFTSQQSDLAKIRTIVPDAAIYLEMAHVATPIRLSRQQASYTASTYPRTSDEQFYTTALLAGKQGADGVSFWNFVYYRDDMVTDDVKTAEPPFHILSHLDDLDWLKRQKQYYFLGRWPTFMGTTNIPAKLEPDIKQTFLLDIYPPEKPKNQYARLRIHTREPIQTETEIVVSINGQRAKTTSDVSAFYENPWDEMISFPDCRRAWLYPANNLSHGSNRIDVLLTGSQSATVEFIDIAVR